MSVIIRTEVLYHATLRDSQVIYGDLYHVQVVRMIQAPKCQLVSRDATEIFTHQMTLVSLSRAGQAIARLLEVSLDNPFTLTSKLHSSLGPQ